MGDVRVLVVAGDASARNNVVASMQADSYEVQAVADSPAEAAVPFVRHADTHSSSGSDPVTPAANRGKGGMRLAALGGPSTAKRFLDVALGTVLALVALPLIGVLAVAVCLSLRTWHPFFVQERVGRDGRTFRLPKLRTLPPDAPAAVDKYALAAVTTTRVGRFLRRSHLDELPQLLLVPVGRMSLVGPRPEMPSLLSSFDPHFVTARSVARPGCTGLWQIGADAGRLIGEAPEYDLYYLRHMSARLDLWVIWQSLRVIAGGVPVSCADVPPWALRPRPISQEAALGSLYRTSGAA